VLEPFADMKAGRINAIIVDEVVGEYYIATDKKDYKAAAVKLTNEPIGACFKKDNTKLRDEVQKAIDSMVSDGTMKKISIKWFGKDLTSNIDPNLKTLGD
jgi:polar amino acid transport system substrate-binding protein